MSSSNRSIVISIALTTAIFGAIAFIGWLERGVVQETASTPPAANDVPQVDASRDATRQAGREARRGAGLPTPQPEVRPAPPLAAGGVHKCRVGGRIVYQDGACPGESAEALDGGTLSVVDATKARAAERSVSATGHGAGRAVPAHRATSSGEPVECPQLRKRVRQIDAAARQRSTQWLTEQRREARDRMYALDCREFD